MEVSKSRLSACFIQALWHLTIAREAAIVFFYLFLPLVWTNINLLT